MYGQGQGRQAVAVALVASPKKPALHLLHCGPSVLCWQFWGEGEGGAQAGRSSPVATPARRGATLDQTGLHEGGALRLSGSVSSVMQELPHSFAERGTSAPS